MVSGPLPENGEVQSSGNEDDEEILPVWGELSGDVPADPLAEAPEVRNRTIM